MSAKLPPRPWSVNELQRKNVDILDARGAVILTCRYHEDEVRDAIINLILSAANEAIEEIEPGEKP